jgi:glucosyl-3-phosphoglycerate synthase
MPTSDHAFTARTYHHRDFEASSLLELKRAAGLRVSVVIPAKDERPTVGHVVATFHRTLVEAVPLVDELVVVDADSADGTAEAARAAGARVVRQSEVLPDAGPGAGKGEALWKGLAATSGDLVVFVDADIRDIDARFVVGLLGPLLVDPELRFTKAAYDRPLATVGGQLQPSGGGRVTELLARPLIASFWPELAWLAQPLSGEYAGRRDLLESLPFVRGYGVELALLVDILERHGASAIAQVDLGRRVHDHQPLDALGRMAGEILHVAVDRLTRYDRLVLTEPLATSLLQPSRTEHGDLDLTAYEVAPSERPPLSQRSGLGAAGDVPTAGGSPRYRG